MNTLKRTFLSILIITTITLSTFATTFIVDGKKYEVISMIDNTVSLVQKNYAGYSGDFIIPEKVVYNNRTFTVISTGYGVFVDCVNLTSLSIPKTVVSIGEQNFNACLKLRSINVDVDNPVYKDIEGVLYSIDGTILYVYPNMHASSYSVPKSTKVIAELAFMACWNLRALELNDGLETIEKNGIYYCKELKSITIPQSVTIIEGSFFRTPLTEVIALNPKPCKANDSSFDNSTYTDANLYVPAGSVNVYSTATGWSNFWTIKEINPSSIEDVEQKQYYAYLNEDTLMIDGAEQENISIVSSNGYIIYKGIYRPIPLTSRGMYIIEINNEIIKILY